MRLHELAPGGERDVQLDQQRVRGEILRRGEVVQLEPLRAAGVLGRGDGDRGPERREDRKEV